MSFGMSHALRRNKTNKERYRKYFAGITAWSWGTKYALVTSGEEPDAIPVSLLSFGIGTLFLDVLGNGVRVHNLVRDARISQYTSLMSRPTRVVPEHDTGEEGGLTMPGQGGYPLTFARTTSLIS